MKYIMYLRKSSESEDRQALSIPAQEAELRELAERRGLEVFDEPLRESMSAKKPGRPLFARMIELLNAGTVAGVLCWHGDRLARNPLDGGVVMWMLGQGTIAEIVTPGKTFTSSSDDKLLLSITFGMATKYSDDLSKNVKRGNLESVKRGIWPGPCKVGYVRDPVSKEHKPDPDRFNRMTQMIWLPRSLGTPAARIYHNLRSSGFTTRPNGRVGGRPLTRSQLYKILHDPFYAGMISYEGQLYQGTHSPMVSIESFEAIQEMFVGRRAVPSHKHHLPYRGLLRCRECTAVVTIERHWRPRYGRTYLYYRCCRKNAAFGYCSEPPVNQTELEMQFEEYLSTLMLPVEVEAAAFDAAVAILRDQIGHASSSRRAIAQRNARLDMQLANLRQQVLDGTFDSTDYRAERSRIALEKERLAQEDGKLAECSRTVIEHNRSLLSLGKLALEKFRSGTSEQKHTIMQMVSLNITLGAKKVVVLAKEPFASLSQLAKMSVQVGIEGQRPEQLEALALSILRTPMNVSKSLMSNLEESSRRDHGSWIEGQTHHLLQ